MIRGGGGLSILVVAGGIRDKGAGIIEEVGVIVVGDAGAGIFGGGFAIIAGIVRGAICGVDTEGILGGGISEGGRIDVGAVGGFGGTTDLFGV
jgi:hypothetical protein